jgi:hypothetical protein
MRPLAPAPTPQERLRTHDSEYTRGFELGYVMAMMETRTDFSRRVLQSNIHELMIVLTNAGASVSQAADLRGAYGVQWCRLEVRFA